MSSLIKVIPTETIHARDGSAAIQAGRIYTADRLQRALAAAGAKTVQALVVFGKVNDIPVVVLR